MRDRIFAVVSLAVAAGYYNLAARLPESDLSDATGPAGLPVTYAILLGLLSLALLATSFTSTPAAGATGVSVPPGPGAVTRPLATLAAGAGYVLAVPVIGYVPAIAALIAAGTVAQGGRLNARTAIVAAGGAAALWLLFVWFLGIEQPSGWWPLWTDPS